MGSSSKKPSTVGFTQKSFNEIEERVDSVVCAGKAIRRMLQAMGGDYGGRLVSDVRTQLFGAESLLTTAKAAVEMAGQLVQSIGVVHADLVALNRASAPHGYAGGPALPSLLPRMSIEDADDDAPCDGCSPRKAPRSKPAAPKRESRKRVGGGPINSNLSQAMKASHARRRRAAAAVNRMAIGGTSTPAAQRRGQSRGSIAPVATRSTARAAGPSSHGRSRATHGRPGAASSAASGQPQASRRRAGSASHRAPGRRPGAVEQFPAPGALAPTAAETGSTE